MLDETHKQGRRSWVTSANVPGTDFPIQNLPFGVFSPSADTPRGGVAIGEMIFDIGAAFAAGLFSEDAAIAAQAASGPVLNPLLALGLPYARALRRQIASLLDESAIPRPELLHEAEACRLHLPVNVSNYTDFYAGIYHAISSANIMRPGIGLTNNYRYIPIAYHGRASSLRPSGGSVRRPNGQQRPDPMLPPVFGPSKRLDLELEMGIFIAGGNELGAPIPIAEAVEQIFGICLLNDWSARDIQMWEAAPLGPFLGKNFSTTLSPWIVTADALAPFRLPAFERPEGDPAPLDYLLAEADQASGGLDIGLTVWLKTKRMRDAGQAAAPIIRSNAKYLYWTLAQMIAHHTSGGCNLQPGDVIGTGTISGPTDDQLSSLLELTNNGASPFTLPNGETRGYLEDFDEISFTANCSRDGFTSIGFGKCTGMIIPAH